MNRYERRIDSTPPARGLFSALHPLVLEVSFAEVIPRGYGVAWARVECMRVVCMPMPLNLLARAGREAFLWVRRGGLPLDGSAAEAYERGRRDERRLWQARERR